MTDAVGICNLALQRIGSKSISSLTEDTAAGRACNRVYTQARDSELRAHPWSFARERVQIAADSTEGRYILTDSGSPINLVYIKRITDEETFDELFVALLIARIAMDIAEMVTHSNKKKEEALFHYREVRKEARRVSAFERPPQELPTDTWLNARL